MEKHKIAVEKLEEERKNKKIPKEISQEILKKIFINLIIAIAIMGYFAILNYSYDKINQDNLVNIIERLNRKLIGMYAYYGINGMFKDLIGLYKYTKYELYRIMRRRSQKKMKIKKYRIILERIPIAKPKIYVQIW